MACVAQQTHAAEATQWNTTELGITVTQAEILEAFESCSAFWPAVCRHIEKRGDDMGSEPVRSAAVSIIRQTQLELHKHFFESDEQTAQDVVKYTAWAVRRTALYQQAEGLAGNRATILRLREEWNEAYDGSTPQPLDVLEAQLLQATNDVLASADLDPAKAEGIRVCARQLAACINQMQATGTAEILRRAELKTKNEQTRSLLRDIVEAADWACMSYSGKRLVGVTEFKAAWAELAESREPGQTTASN
jgi:hypothetical protein